MADDTGAVDTGNAGADVSTSADTGGQQVTQPQTSEGSLLGADPTTETGGWSIDSVLNKDGSFKEDWNKHLGIPELAESSILSNYKSLHTALKSLDHSQRLVGKKVLAPKDMDDATREEFYRSMGVPEKPEEYGFTPPQELPEGVMHDPQGDAWFAQTAKELNLPKDTAMALRDKYLEHLGGSVAKLREAQADAEGRTLAEADAKLTEMYNGNEDLKNQAIVKARNMVESVEGVKAEAVSFINWNDPASIQFFANMADKLGNDKLADFSTEGVAQSRKEMEMRVKEIMAQPAYLDLKAPDNPKLRAEYKQLMAKLYGE